LRVKIHQRQVHWLYGKNRGVAGRGFWFPTGRDASISLEELAKLNKKFYFYFTLYFRLLIFIIIYIDPFLF
jgi:hypothetical protein